MRRAGEPLTDDQYMLVVGYLAQWQSHAEDERARLVKALRDLLEVQYDGDPRRQADCDLCHNARTILTELGEIE